MLMAFAMVAGADFRPNGILRYSQWALPELKAVFWMSLGSTLIWWNAEAKSIVTYVVHAFVGQSPTTISTKNITQRRCILYTTLSILFLGFFVAGQSQTRKNVSRDCSRVAILKMRVLRGLWSGIIFFEKKSEFCISDGVRKLVEDQ
ncbi:unnamed protein product [Nesidiocoris tenuis]|uniref:Uncharacterized protein n=2 Tax=Nesidiocoris tenuis TaxID=355587 RepID=A0A6H5GXL8_9HEMI|nr:unnamed protein product [Nesidiocoris tenuis]